MVKNNEQLASIKRGDIWLVVLDETTGHEVAKTRPAIVVQNNIGNTYSPLTIVVPLTTQGLDHVYPMEAILSASSLKTTGKALCSHVRSIDKKRLVKRLGTLSAQDLSMVDKALAISLGLN